MSNPLLKDTLERTAKIIGHKANVRLICRGNSTPQTDGTTIILPSLPSPCPADLERLYHGSLDHELGHTMHTDFSIIPKFRKKWGEQGFSVLNVVEDIRIEALMEQQYPGSKINLKTGYDIISKRWSAQMDSVSLWNRTLGCLFTTGKRAMGPDFGNDARQIVALVKPLILKAARLESTQAAARMSVKIIKIWKEWMSNNPETQEVKEFQASMNVTQDSQGMTLAGELSKELNEMPVAQDSGHYRIYSKEHDEVKIAQNCGPEKYLKMLAEVRPLVAGMRQRLLMTLKANKQCRIAPDENGPLLHKKRLHRLLLPVAESPLARKIKAPVNDVAATLLIDLSGSMSGNRIRLARRCAVLLAEVMDQLKYPLEVIGFTTSADHSRIQAVAKESGLKPEEIEKQFTRFIPLLHVIYKSFNESLKACRGRFASMGVGDYTPLNESIIFAGKRMLSTKPRKRLLIVLTDGACSLGNPRSEEITEQNLKDNLEILTKAGIQTVAVGIQTDAVKKNFQNSIVVNELAELPKQFFTLLTKTLLNAATGKGN